MSSGRKTNGIRMGKDMSKAGSKAGGALAQSLLKVIAVGLIGGVATIAGSDKLGQGIEKLQEKQKKLTAETKEKYRQAVMDATANEIETETEVK